MKKYKKRALEIISKVTGAISFLCSLYLVFHILRSNKCCVWLERIEIQEILMALSRLTLVFCVSHSHRRYNIEDVQPDTSR
mmetsp:Transcript_18049/g.20813  ORF Transcript_18049/g.20813 Transcript_18049/m.20813 type:complete len:81 (-) Transcript_18049:54-296(-)